MPLINMYQNVFIHSFIWIIAMPCVKGSGLTEYYSISLCSDAYNQDIIQANVIHQSQERSLTTCASSCTDSLDCYYAIFRRSMQQCLRIHNRHVPQTEDPGYGQETECYVLWKNKPCQNGAVLYHTCQQCPSTFTDRRCEKPNSDYCESREWKQTSGGDLDNFVDSQLPVKCKMTENSVTRIYNLQTFGNRSGIQYFQAHHFLAVNSATGRFQIPIELEFKFYTSSSNTLSTMHLTLEGDESSSSVNDVDFSLWTPVKIDDNRLFYQFHQISDSAPLLDGLAHGFRLMSRDPTRVGFKNSEGEAYYESVRRNVGATETAWNTPYYYYSTKTVLTTRDYFILRTKIKTGTFVSSDTETSSPDWDLDVCWWAVDPNLDYDELTNVLKETVLLGHDLRLVMDGSISSDVTMVTLTNTDVIVALADYLTPFDAVSPLNEDTRMIFSLITASKTLAECNMAFQGNSLYNERIVSYQQNLEWFIRHSQASAESLTITPDGDIEGSLASFNNRTLHAGNIRVCLKMSASETVCSGTTVVYSAADDDDHITIQTPAVLKPDIDTQGKLAGNGNCKQTVRLLSTKGWVEEVSYRFGQDVSSADVTSLKYIKMDWFV